MHFFLLKIMIAKITGILNKIIIKIINIPIMERGTARLAIQ
jgi:tetrahydromethanopterin S-methyltransferase subunit C